MARRRRSNVSDFLSNFNAAMQIGSEIGKSIEMGRINAADDPDHLEGFTEDQGRELEKLASQGYEIAAGDDGLSYTATRGDDVRNITTQGVTDFMGERHVGTLDRGTVSEMARAGVLSKYDPEEGLKMRKSLREDRASQREEERAAGIAAIDQELGDYWKQALDGREPTPGDLSDMSMRRAYKLAEAGYGDAAQKAASEARALAFGRIELESADRKQAMGKAASAAAMGNYEPLVHAMNQYIPSGLKVIGVKPGKGDTLDIQYAGAGGEEQSYSIPRGELGGMLAAIEDPHMLYQMSQSQFMNNLRLAQDRRAEDANVRAGRADDRAERADGRAASAEARAQESHDDSRAEAERVRGESEAQQAAKSGAIETLGQERGMSDAEIAAAQAGVIDMGKSGGSGGGTSMLQNAQALLDAGLAKSMPEAITMARQTSSKSPQDRYADALKRAQDIYPRDMDRARQMADAYMSELDPDWQSPRDRVQSDRLAKVREKATPEAIAATAKKYNITEDEVKKRLGIE